MEKIENDQEVDVGNFQFLQHWQHQHQNEDSEQLSGNFNCNELLLVPAVSLPEGRVHFILL